MNNKELDYAVIVAAISHVASSSCVKAGGAHVAHNSF